MLLGITHGDIAKDCDWMCGKIANLRIFSDDVGKMNRSVKDCEGDILLISQFTLYGDANGGRRPSFTEAARPEIAKCLYEECVKKLESSIGKSVARGIFGASMQVHLINDGPVTLIIETNKKKV